MTQNKGLLLARTPECKSTLRCGILVLTIIFILYWTKRSIQSIQSIGYASLSEVSHSENRPINHIEYTDLWNLRTNIRALWFHGSSLAQSKSDKRALNDAHVMISEAIEKMMNLSLEVRKRELDALKIYVHRKIVELQNPRDCSTSKLLVCQVTARCGFGCFTHHIVNCLFRALESKRTMVYRHGRWGYDSDGWEHTFRPLGKCKHTGDVEMIPNITEDIATDERVVKLVQNTISSWIPFTVPSEIAPHLLSNHGSPFVWWTSQLTSYVTRLQPWLQTRIEEKARSLEFRNPIVGIQIRRGDKLIDEAVYHSVEEYMFFAEQWFNQREVVEKSAITTRSVYLATEDVSFLTEFETRYPRYRFIVNNVVAKKAHRARYSEEGLVDVLEDIFLLSQCNYIVCTMSSSVCRTAYELMTSKHADASTMMQSIDMPHRFKLFEESRWKAIANHKRGSVEEIDLREGDDLIVSINAYASYNAGKIYGQNQRTLRNGTFPATKARMITQLHSYLIFEDVDSFLKKGNLS